jgi:hypothetical protein
MNRLTLLAALLGPLALTACAQSPDAIPAQYVSSVPYERWDCGQLGEEQQHLSTALATASAQQLKARSNDTIGVLFLGLPTASMSGENIAPQIALLKGQQEAVGQAMISRKCSGVSPGGRT